MNQEKSGLDEALSTGAHAAHAVQGLVKTGKAVSGAARGAAMGGPYGAAAGALWGARKQIGRILLVVVILLMLPVLFILMLPPIIFGGLTGDRAAGSALPVLNDNSAITGNINHQSGFRGRD